MSNWARVRSILFALASRPNEPVSKRDLLAWVWPEEMVEEGSLRFHIAALRKTLGDGKDGAHYITTLAGRGYCFVAPIARPSAPVAAPVPEARALRHADLPDRLSRMVGRAKDVLAVSQLLAVERFVAIVGSGGVGKTTVAVAHDLLTLFDGAVLFIDLGTLIAPDLTGTAVASMLGLSVQSDDATPSVIAHLRDKRIFLVFDTCEHLVEAAAPLMARIFADAPQVYMLATSREALRVEGEHVYKLEPLAVPPDDPALTASVVETFPAIQVFVERAVAGGARLDLSDANAAVVADICRKLDGVALAIELAAGQSWRLRPAADGGFAGSAPDAFVAGAAHGTAAPEDTARHAGMELRVAADQDVGEANVGDGRDADVATSGPKGDRQLWACSTLERTCATAQVEHRERARQGTTMTVSLPPERVLS
jgi:hypothetical protein